MDVAEVRAVAYIEPAEAVTIADISAKLDQVLLEIQKLTRKRWSSEKS